MKRIRIGTTQIVLIALVIVIVIGAILVGTVGRNFFSAGWSRSYRRSSLSAPRSTSR